MNHFHSATLNVEFLACGTSVPVFGLSCTNV